MGASSLLKIHLYPSSFNIPGSDSAALSVSIIQRILAIMRRPFVSMLFLALISSNLGSCFSLRVSLWRSIGQGQILQQVTKSPSVRQIFHDRSCLRFTYVKICRSSTAPFRIPHCVMATFQGLVSSHHLAMSQDNSTSEDCSTSQDCSIRIIQCDNWRLCSDKHYL